MRLLNSEDDLPGGKTKQPSLAARGENDRVAIERAVDDISSAGDERQVGEAIGRRLRPHARHRAGAVDLRKHLWLGRLLDRVDLCPLDNEANVNVGGRIADDDDVAGLEIFQMKEDLGSSQGIVDVPGDRRRSHFARDAAAAIPEDRKSTRLNSS